MQNAKLRIRAFTLIELLVVIGVIAILAGILIGVLPAARSKAVRGTVRTELKALETVIESYKAKHNFYPPDNPKDVARPPLYYELTGTTYDAPGGQNEYRSRFAPNDPPIKASDLGQLFGLGGFLNTAPASEASDVQSFYKNLLGRQVREFPAANNLPAYKLLVAPRRGMDMQPAVWRYNKSNPTNNQGGFDLWAEIELRGNTVIIGNWEN